MLLPDPSLLVGLDAPEQTIGASPTRRMFALIAVYSLGGLLIWGAFQGDGNAFRMLFLVLLGAGFLFAAERMRRATTLAIVLDGDGLRDSAGTVLARWDQIEKIDRGTFANKPSNGFSVVLREKSPAVWAPGMWWRIGRRVGVGGVLPGRPTRFMGEQMAVYLASMKATQDANERG